MNLLEDIALNLISLNETSFYYSLTTVQQSPTISFQSHLIPKFKEANQHHLRSSSHFAHWCSSNFTTSLLNTI